MAKLRKGTPKRPNHARFLRTLTEEEIKSTIDEDMRDIFPGAENCTEEFEFYLSDGIGYDVKTNTYCDLD